MTTTAIPAGTTKFQKLNGDTWEDINIEASGFFGFKYAAADSHPTRLSWQCKAAEHTFPLPYRTFLRFWVEGAVRPDGGTQDATHPLFEGYLETIEPGGDSTTVSLTAYDPTYRLANEFVLMSSPYQWDDVDGVSEGFAGYPRCVWNSTIDNDDDFAFSLGQRGSISQMIYHMMVLMHGALRACHACPDDLDQYPIDPYDLFDDGIPQITPDDYESGIPGSQSSTTLVPPASTTAAPDTSSLALQPQEKQVFESESLRSAISRLLQTYCPSYRMFWQPGERLWRFYDIKASEALTFTANDADADYPILNMSMQRNVEGRYGAVKFYGPERLIVREALWQRVQTQVNELNDISDGPILETYAAGTPVFGKNKWQIADFNWRRIGRKMPYAITVPVVEYAWGNADRSLVYELFINYIETWSPAFLVRYSESNAGSDEWRAIAGWRLDSRNGIVHFGSTYVYRYNYAPPIIGGIQQPHIENPSEVKLIYPAFDIPISVRYPSSGFGGTIYSVAGIESVLKQYDEMLSVGKQNNIAVTTSTRLAKYQEIAQYKHAQIKDIVYSGGISLHGIHWDLAWLNRRVNLTALDADGNSITTGWEAIGAPVTDVEFDFNEDVTTITFSSDFLEQIGFDVDLLRERLKIRDASLQYWFTWSSVFTTVNRFTQFGTPIVGQNVQVWADVGAGWLDAEGNLQ